MKYNEFHELLHLVLDSPSAPPKKLFLNGFDDWRVRARLAHFLSLPSMNKEAQAIELFRSVVEEIINEENVNDVEEKIYALQKLGDIYKNNKNYESAIYYINLSIELAESTDFLYKYIQRGELWAERWNILHLLGNTAEAVNEINDRIEVFENIPVHYNSYLYYGYRFKAQLSAEENNITPTMNYMKKALNYMNIPTEYAEKINFIFLQKHENASWFLNSLDLATPAPDSIKWDI